MQVISFRLFVLGAAALPTNTTSTVNDLEARAFHYPWIGSFPEAQCAGSHQGPRPKIKGTFTNCVKFTPQTENVNMYWGTGTLKQQSLFVYDGEECNGKKPYATYVKGDSSEYSCLNVPKKEWANWVMVSAVGG